MPVQLSNHSFVQAHIDARQFPTRGQFANGSLTRPASLLGLISTPCAKPLQSGLTEFDPNKVTRTSNLPQSAYANRQSSTACSTCCHDQCSAVVPCQDSDALDPCFGDLERLLHGHSGTAMAGDARRPSQPCGHTDPDARGCRGNCRMHLDDCWVESASTAALLDRVRESQRPLTVGRS